MVERRSCKYEAVHSKVSKFWGQEGRPIQQSGPLCPPNAASVGCIVQCLGWSLVFVFHFGVDIKFDCNNKFHYATAIDYFVLIISAYSQYLKTAASSI